MGNDRCLDAGCFQVKCSNFLERQLATLEQTMDGGPVLKITDNTTTKSADVLTRWDYNILAQDDEVAPGLIESGRVRQAIVMEGKQAGQLVQVVVKPELANAADPRAGVAAESGRRRRSRPSRTRAKPWPKTGECAGRSRNYRTA